MYSEILKIIESGLKNDKARIINYANLLSDKLVKDGESEYGQRIKNILANKSGRMAVSDALVAPPVDQESRLEIVNIEYSPECKKIVLAPQIKERLKDFEDTVSIKEQLDRLGIPCNLSLLLYGFPGCGKTSIAYCIANKLNLPLVTARLDTMISSLLGNTSKNIHRIFEFASKQPCVLFLDEFDAIAKARDDKNELGELKRVVNSLLQNMDNYCHDGILVAATNHQELLDDAIWRRFQTVIEVPKPGIDEIQQMFMRAGTVLELKEINVKQRKLIIEQMIGLSYSEIQQIVQNVIKQKLISKTNNVTVIDFLKEIAIFKFHGNIQKEKIVSYLLEMGLSQRAISEYFGVSTRQIKNCLDTQEEYRIK